MTLIGDVSADLKNVLNYIDKAQAELDNSEPVFDMHGKKLEYLCKMQPHYLVRYKKCHSDMKSIYDLVSSKRDVVQSRLWRKYNEGYQRALSTRDIQSYISGEPEYVQLTELMLEVAHIRDQFDDIVKALESMAWMLSHITKQRVAEIQDTVL